MRSIRSSMACNLGVYHSLDSALTALTSAKLHEVPEVQKVLTTCIESGIVVKDNAGNYNPNLSTKKLKDPNAPFVVLEGLDGSGKTSLLSEVQKRFRMQSMQTPPAEIMECRQFFDNQTEPIRRAFYSLGNYLASEKVLQCPEPVIMDRFWHSTAAYALGNAMKTNPESVDLDSLNYEWPADLLKPNMVIFLSVSEAERLRRHSTRLLQTNTPEERSLAKNEAFRNHIINFCRSIRGPDFFEVNADSSREVVQEAIYQALVNAFPALNQRCT